MQKPLVDHTETYLNHEKPWLDHSKAWVNHKDMYKLVFLPFKAILEEQKSKKIAIFLNTSSSLIFANTELGQRAEKVKVTPSLVA